MCIWGGDGAYTLSLESREADNRKDLENSISSWWGQRAIHLRGPKDLFLENSTQCGHFLLWGWGRHLISEPQRKGQPSHPWNNQCRSISLCNTPRYRAEVVSFKTSTTLTKFTLRIYTKPARWKHGKLAKLWVQKGISYMPVDKPHCLRSRWHFCQHTLLIIRDNIFHNWQGRAPCVDLLGECWKLLNIIYVIYFCQRPY